MSARLAMTLEPRKDYSAFRIDPANRDLNERHTERIAECIDKWYMLDLYPIVTTSTYTIIDGQNRFMCAKEMRIPFYAIPDNTLTIESAATANHNTHDYSIEEIVDVYSKMGLESYVYLSDFLGKYKRMPSEVAARLLDITYGRAFIREGTFAVRRPVYADEFAKHMTAMASVQGFLMASVYRDVLAKLFVSPEYDPTRMLDRARKVPKRFVRCTKEAEALSVLNDIYNYGITTKNRLNLSALSCFDNMRFDKKSKEIVSVLPDELRGVPYKKCVDIWVDDDLSKFKIHPSARKIGTSVRFNETQKYLIAAMKLDNLLRCYPIIVDKDMVILDGARRFTAAAALGVPVHYIVAENASLWMIAQAGTRVRSWMAKDYIKHYCELGREEYIYLRNLHENHKFVSVNTLVKFLSDYRGWYTAITKFQTGNLVLSNKSETENTLFWLNKITDNKLRSDKVFQCTLYDVCGKYRNIDFGRLIDSVNASLAGQIPVSIYPYSDAPSCLYRMQQIYNYRLHMGNQVFFDGARPEGRDENWGAAADI